MNNSSQEFSSKENRLQKIKEEAALWLVELEESPSDDEKRASFHKWYQADEEHKKCFIKIAKTWNDLDALSELAFTETKTEKPDTVNETGIISWIVNFFSSKQNGAISARPLRSAIAFSVVFSLVVMSVFFQDAMERPNSQVYASTYGEQQKQSLSDGSTIWINSNSQVTVQFDSHRRYVRLDKGEAFFEVAKDPARPFEVYSGDKMVRAIGTAFSVYQNENSVEVLVSEGIVEFGIVKIGNVIANAASELLTDKDSDNEQSIEILGELVANQQVIIEQGTQSTDQGYEAVVLQLNEEDVKSELMWLEGKLVFKGEPLEDVVKEISRHLSIRIDIPDAELKQIKIEGHFEAGNTESLFFVLENGFNIDVRHLSEDHVELKARK